MGLYAAGGRRRGAARPGLALKPDHGWGCLSLGAAILAFQAALNIEMGGRRGPGAVWLAERKGLAWLMLPFAATGWWATGLGALAAYAAGSFFWVQRQVHRPKDPAATGVAPTGTPES